MKNVQLSEMSKKNLKPSKRGKYCVILYNDNKNTFEHVTDCLMDIGGHTYHAAVQCALIVHRAGKCAVIEDNYDICFRSYRSLMQCNLQVSLEKL